MWWLSSTFLQIKCKFLLLIPSPLKDQVGQLALKLTLLPVVPDKLSWHLPFYITNFFHQRWDTCTSTPIKNTWCFIWYGSYSGISSLQYREKIPWNQLASFCCWRPPMKQKGRQSRSKPHTSPGSTSSFAWTVQAISKIAQHSIIFPYLGCELWSTQSLSRIYAWDTANTPMDEFMLDNC